MGNARKEARRATVREKEAANKKAIADKIHKSKKNNGGFYEGMPGVFLDKNGNRRIYEISVTPEGDVISRMGCDPKLAFICFADLVKNGDFSRAFIIKLADDFKKDRDREKKVLSIYNWFRKLMFWKKTKPTQTPTSQLSDEEYQKKLDGLKDDNEDKEELDEAMGVQPVNLKRVDNQA